MDSGKGGCNDNALVENDFSYAPTNGIEVTFSRNYIFNNRIYDCDHGIWGGYSYDSRISKNKFRNNRIGIAIEHGQDNKIDYNIFYGDKEAIKLWARKEQPSDWGYSKNRDTKSRDYVIAFNSFNSNPVVFDLSLTDSLNIFSNTHSGEDIVFKLDSGVTRLDTLEDESITQKLQFDSSIVFPLIENALDPFKGSGLLSGRKNILITEWGPYDFRSPVIWNTNPADTSVMMKFDLLGPKGKWKIKNYRGVKNISAMSGEFPAAITAEKNPGGRTDIFIQLEFVGSAITTPFGTSIAAGKPYLFSFKNFFQPIDFTVNWIDCDTSVYNPITSEGLFPPNVRMAPFKTEKTNKLDYAWWGGIKTDEGEHKQFITVAEGVADLPKGEYDLGVTWDDAVRVYVDGKLVIDEWNPSLYKFDESPHKAVRLTLGGQHTFRVEHVELGGFATLNLKLKKEN